MGGGSNNTKFSYQRLRYDGEFEEEEEGGDRMFERTKSWSRTRSFSFRKRRKVRIPGLRRFFKRRARLVISKVRFPWGKVIKRFKESGSHLGDLFAGNYLFMQISPTSFKCLEKSFMDHNNYHLNGLPSKYTIQRIA